MKTNKIKIRSKVKAPPTKVFLDKRKENEKRRCRNKGANRYAKYRTE